jgi:uncharacterized membrane protein
LEKTAFARSIAMNFHTSMLVLHVLTAVLGMGAFGSLALLTISSWYRVTPLAIALGAINSLALLGGISLGVMLLTGIGLLYASDWALGRAPWMETALVLFILAGASAGILRAQVRRAVRPGTTPKPALAGRVRMLSWITAVLVVAIIVLMVAKPG